MANILDYLEWRGDIPLAQVPLGDIDLLVLCGMSYSPFDEIVPGGFDRDPVPLGQAVEQVVRLAGKEGDGRHYHLKEDEKLLRALAESPRFCELSLTGYINIHSTESEEQFAAVTALLPQGGAVVLCRGTDGSIVGWKEDFNMSFSDSVAAQRDAADYVQAVASHVRGPLTVAGHSKGGNLAVYASAFCPKSVQRRIACVRNFDGPGFQAVTVAKEGFQRILDRIHTYLPQSSIVGMLLEHDEDFTIIESQYFSVFQHNLYFWEVKGGGFVTVEQLTNSSQFVDAAVKDWVAGISPELREKVINGVYEAFEESDVRHFRDLLSGKNTWALLRAAGNTDEETRAAISEGLRVLGGAMKRSLPVLGVKPATPKKLRLSKGKKAPAKPDPNGAEPAGEEVPPADENGKKPAAPKKKGWFWGIPVVSKDKAPATPAAEEEGRPAAVETAAPQKRKREKQAGKKGPGKEKTPEVSG